MDKRSMGDDSVGKLMFAVSLEFHMSHASNSNANNKSQLTQVHVLRSEQKLRPNPIQRYSICLRFAYKRPSHSHSLMRKNFGKPEEILQFWTWTFWRKYSQLWFTCAPPANISVYATAIVLHLIVCYWIIFGWLIMAEEKIQFGNERE